MKKDIRDFTIVSNKRLTQNHFLLRLKAPAPILPVAPGQFVQVLVPGSRTTFLRRPISIHNVGQDGKSLDLLIQIKGNGTRALSELREGEYLNLIYPLGNTFTIYNKANILLVGGGCGVAPLLYLARRLREAECKVQILLGARSQSYLFEMDEFAKFGDLLCTTEDGSLGTSGFVTSHPVFKEPAGTFDMIYSCGPEVMMKAVAKIAADSGTACEVSLENTMACGIGACLCCVVDTTTGHRCVCTEGPVFNTKDLKWKI
jgi:dihydroorotate dehydrogenase electron transfer subunit